MDDDSKTSTPSLPARHSTSPASSRPPGVSGSGPGSGVPQLSPLETARLKMTVLLQLWGWHRLHRTCSNLPMIALLAVDRRIRHLLHNSLHLHVVLLEVPYQDSRSEEVQQNDVRALGNRLTWVIVWATFHQRS
ncbi:hypothetical protein KIN20_026555 [Parelaphostrongylus tenuis]|uniref:Uncharacterized protein n=1 Tax=Parelaphostrongylus tenuis TaxID=148309 RepID=A0AAD5QY71_PARTN|nr:hypothetical protein KIN20_026555 [Parelaphostrongylus tenuis]